MALSNALQRFLELVFNNSQLEISRTCNVLINTFYHWITSV